jgi:hypothetical protein
MGEVHLSNLTLVREKGMVFHGWDEKKRWKVNGRGEGGLVVSKREGP